VLIRYTTIYTVGALGVVVLVLAIVQARRRPQHEVLWSRVALAALLTAIVAFAGFAVGGRVVVLTGTSPDVTYSNYLVLGSTTIHGVEVSRDGYTGWLVNDSSIAIRIVTVQYVDQLHTIHRPKPYPDEMIEPHTTAHGTFDNFGPDDPPPGAIQGRDSGFRKWATWGLQTSAVSSH
jgi:hypothetical protein